MDNGRSLRFVDLFAGLGGFHVALSRLGHECVFAAEIDNNLRNLYHRNFGLRPASDVRFCWKDVPPHDVLCADSYANLFLKQEARRVLNARILVTYSNIF